MMWRGAAGIFALASLLGEAQSNAITITEYASVCSAVYTTGSKSVTVVQSTVTVQPIPWTDATANSGTPFVLGIQFGGGSRKRAAPAYLTADGNTTTDTTQATWYTVINGQLSDSNGHYVSTSSSTLSQPLAVSVVTSPITTTFHITNSVLGWNNSAFDNGVAEFFSTPAGVVNNAQIITRFNGAIDPSWSAISFHAVPASSFSQSPSGYASQSTSVATNIFIGSLSATAGTPGGSSGSAGGNGGSPTAVGSMSNVAVPSASTGATSPLASTSAASMLSLNGLCGSTNGGWVCPGSGFGDCCGGYGYCGDGAAFCGTDCQAAYGSCSASSPSSAASTPTSAMPITMSMSMGGMTPSTTSSSMAAGPTFACPANNGAIVTDMSGAQYTIGCGEDTSVDSTSSAAVSNGFNDCFALCDTEAGCTAFTYSGGANGIGGGICYFKDGSSTFTSGTSYQVGAIMGSAGVASSTLSIFTTPGQPIGPNNPGSPSMTAYNTSTPRGEVYTTYNTSLAHGLIPPSTSTSINLEHFYAYADATGHA
ncbi:hypothetical protein LTR85_000861 [Meristemomyces frigidus]|nr:hypothetical protein LTR85_000861 [Meristemomyces frigidus]